MVGFFKFSLLTLFAAGVGGEPELPPTGSDCSSSSKHPVAESEGEKATTLDSAAVPGGPSVLLDTAAGTRPEGGKKMKQWDKQGAELEEREEDEDDDEEEDEDEDGEENDKVKEIRDVFGGQRKVKRGKGRKAERRTAGRKAKRGTQAAICAAGVEASTISSAGEKELQNNPLPPAGAHAKILHRDPSVATDLYEYYADILGLNASRVPQPPVSASDASSRPRGPLDVVRLHDPDLAVFESWAELGVPMVVSGVVEKWRAGRAWDCEWFARNFPEQYVEPWGDADYGAAGESIVGDVTALSDERLKRATPKPGADGAPRAGPTKLKHAWKREPDAFPPEGSAEDEERDTSGRAAPSHLAWYWYAILRQFGERATKSARKLLANYTPMPRFLRYEDKANRYVYSSRMELFMGWPKTGARAHADPVCEHIASVQFRGTKRWRFALPRDPANATGLFLPNETLWSLAHAPVFETDVRAGEIVVFPPGWIHETLSQSPKRKSPDSSSGGDGDDGKSGEGTEENDTKEASSQCGVSISLQFANPSPLAMLKAFPRRVARTAANFCFRKRWNLFIFGQHDPIPTRRAAMAAHAAMDGDGDGAIDCAEATDHFALASRGRKWTDRELSFDDRTFRKDQDILDPSPMDTVAEEVTRGRSGDVVIPPIMKEDYAQAARRFILYNDHDGDGRVDRDELAKTYGLARGILKAKNAFLVT